MALLESEGMTVPLRSSGDPIRCTVHYNPISAQKSGGPEAGAWGCPPTMAAGPWRRAKHSPARQSNRTVHLKYRCTVVSTVHLKYRTRLYLERQGDSSGRRIRLRCTELAHRARAPNSRTELAHRARAPSSRTEGNRPKFRRNDSCSMSTGGSGELRHVTAGRRPCRHRVILRIHPFL